MGGITYIHTTSTTAAVQVSLKDRSTFLRYKHTPPATSLPRTLHIQIQSTFDYNGEIIISKLSLYQEK